ncbi:MAG: hypothetical protein HY901_27220 [Deltaproteobacteria bacterium]|nr:hypothetical protein [Deltaproteobacteria bacterium]
MVGIGVRQVDPPQVCRVDDGLDLPNERLAVREQAGVHQLGLLRLDEEGVDRQQAERRYRHECWKHVQALPGSLAH